LASPRGRDIAPVFISKPTSAVLHEWDGKSFRSGPQAWPVGHENERIDALAGMNWEALKKSMSGGK
jgi:hypothetical protein